MEKITASIITIGDELLIGQVVDTNSGWMAQELNKIGVWVQYRVAVGDVKDDIIKALDEEGKRSNIILITGGLGPTKDDITKPLLCEYFGGKMVVDESALANVKNIFETILKLPMLENNLKQAEVPDVCTVIQNRRGTAPGMWFEKEGKIFVSMPGVPHEMKGMMSDNVLTLLQQRFNMPHIVHRTLLVAGIGESFLAELIKNWENSLPPNIKLAYLPNYGMVRLRLTTNGDNKDEVEKELDIQFNELKRLVQEYLVVDEDIALEALTGRLLKENNKTVATAESCTGGYIAHLLTSFPGASTYYMGGIVSYANDVKENLLSVDQDIINKHGAVSEETVRAMAKNVLEKINANYAIAVSGIMGPDGGSAEKPVGTVWIVVANQERAEVKKMYFRFDRKRNIELTATNALNLLRIFILKEAKFK